MAEELTKGPDEIYCPECGRTIKRGLSGCPYCYADFKKMFFPEERTEWNNSTSTFDKQYGTAVTPSGKVPAKNKVAAIVLAVFLGYWSWLYTYRKNSIKFWSTLGVFAIIFVINISYSCSFIRDAMSGATYPGDYFSGGFMVFAILAYIIYLFIWIWAVVDNVVKPERFYTDYPNG